MITTAGTAYEYKDGVAVKTTRPAADNLSDEVMVLWHDRRQISPEQRRKAWALVGEISQAYGYLSNADKTQVNGDLKREFLLKRMDDLTAEAIKAFSLGDVDMTTARMYITFLVEFCIEHGIPTKDPLWELCDDIEAYVYACCMNGVCAVCRRRAGLHHVDAVGMGRDRTEICHIGMRAIPLCWGVGGHHQEAHQLGDDAFKAKYHLVSVVIDEKIAKKHKLKGEQKNESVDDHR